MAEKTIQAFLDRIEGDIAVLLVGEADTYQVLWPAGGLPDDAVEGCVLRFVVSADPSATEAENKKIDTLIDELKREDTN